MADEIVKTVIHIKDGSHTFIYMSLAMLLIRLICVQIDPLGKKKTKPTVIIAVVLSKCVVISLSSTSSSRQ